MIIKEKPILSYHYHQNGSYRHVLEKKNKIIYIQMNLYRVTPKLQYFNYEIAYVCAIFLKLLACIQARAVDLLKIFRLESSNNMRENFWD